MKKINEYMKSGEAAEFLGVNIRTIRQWQKSGMLKGYINPINKWRLYLKEDLEAMLDKINGKEAI